MADFGSTKFASGLRDCKRPPVSNEFSSNENDEAQTRRAVLSALAAIPSVGIAATAYAALTGTVVGAPAYRIGIDLTAVADAWIEDASDLGMVVMRGPDGNLWRAMAIDVSAERVEAQDRHWHKLNNRPRLLRAVHAAVERPAFA